MRGERDVLEGDGVAAVLVEVEATCFVVFVLQLDTGSVVVSVAVDAGNESGCCGTLPRDLSACCGASCLKRAAAAAALRMKKMMVISRMGCGSLMEVHISALLLCRCCRHHRHQGKQNIEHLAHTDCCAFGTDGGVQRRSSHQGPLTRMGILATGRNDGLPISR